MEQGVPSINVRQSDLSTDWSSHQTSLPITATHTHTLTHTHTHTHTHPSHTHIHMLNQHLKTVPRDQEDIRGHYIMSETIGNYIYVSVCGCSAIDLW